MLLLLGTEGAGDRESYPTNDMTNKYIYDTLLMLLFFHFLVL